VTTVRFLLLAFLLSACAFPWGGTARAELRLPGRVHASATEAACLPGGSVTVVLTAVDQRGKGGTGSGAGLGFRIVRAPESGDISPVRIQEGASGVARASVTYRHRGGGSRRLDSFDFVVVDRRGSEVARGTASVRIQGAELTIDAPPVVVFPDTPVGSKSGAEVGIRNSGRSAGTAVLAADAPFHVESTTPLALAPDWGTPVRVIFRPRTTGEFTGTLHLNGDEAGVLLRGTAVLPFSLQTAELRCGTVTVGASTTGRVAVVNQLRETLTLRVGAAEPFRLFGETLRVDARGTAWVEVVFAPTSAGVERGTLRLQHEAGARTVRLSGEGLPVVAVEPAAVPGTNVVVEGLVTNQVALDPDGAPEAVPGIGTNATTSGVAQAVATGGLGGELESRAQAAARVATVPVALESVASRSAVISWPVLKPGESVAVYRRGLIVALDRRSASAGWIALPMREERVHDGRVWVRVFGLRPGVTEVLDARLNREGWPEADRGTTLQLRTPRDPEAKAPETPAWIWWLGAGGAVGAAWVAWRLRTRR
jgi:hypothetical protein